MLFLNSNRVTSILSSAKLGLNIWLFEKATYERSIKHLAAMPFKLSIVEDKFPTERLLEGSPEMRKFDCVEDFGKFVYDKTVECVQAQ